MKNNSVLGRGLSSLLKEEIIPVAGEKNIDWLPIEQLVVGTLQPRKFFDQDKIKELADSITSKGLLQPIVVNKTDTAGQYQIVAGERRYRACKLAGITDVPVIIKELNEEEILEVALVENIQREELTAIEEAEGFEKLIQEFGYSQSDIAAAVDKSRSHIANLLRLNSLSAPIKELVNTGQLTMGHARCLIGIENAEELASRIISEGLSVRRTEQLTKKNPGIHRDKKPSTASNDNRDNSLDLKSISDSLSAKFHTRVNIENVGEQGGRIILHYNNLEELDLVLSRLG